MPKLRVLSGKEIVAIFASFGFTVIGQKGSHMKLRRDVNGVRQVLTIPMHRELDKGTTKAIYTQALRFISDDDLRPHFFTQ